MLYNISRPVFPFKIAQLFDGKTFWNRNYGPGNPPYLQSCFWCKQTKVYDDSEFEDEIIYHSNTPESIFGEFKTTDSEGNEKIVHYNDTCEYGIIVQNPIAGNEYAVRRCAVLINPEDLNNIQYRELDEFIFTLSKSDCYEYEYKGFKACSGFYKCTPNIINGVLQDIYDDEGNLIGPDISGFGLSFNENGGTNVNCALCGIFSFLVWGNFNSQTHTFEYVAETFGYPQENCSFL